MKKYLIIGLIVIFTLCFLSCSPTNKRKVTELDCKNGNEVYRTIKESSGNETFLLVNCGGIVRAGKPFKFNIGEPVKAQIIDSSIEVNASGITIDGMGQSFISTKALSGSFPIIKLSSEASDTIVQNIGLLEGSQAIKIDREASVVLKNIHTRNNRKSGILVGNELSDKGQQIINNQIGGAVQLSPAFGEKKSYNSFSLINKKQMLSSYWQRVVEFSINGADAQARDCTYRKSNNKIEVLGDGRTAHLCGEISSSRDLSGITVNNNSVLVVDEASVVVSGAIGVGVSVTGGARLRIENAHTLSVSGSGLDNLQVVSATLSCSGSADLAIDTPRYTDDGTVANCTCSGDTC